ncbi:hypothetical protein EOD42_03130 [Rhodovarius crocodyli]|uniref:ATP-binding protein n=2 Tax=Rhodovarius crocodyli TaxID=1979269 RepID=A0A437MN85_9PROT|nr:hypothetical protein EOD42_03130 [Rhodovarius crocodyli]
MKRADASIRLRLKRLCKIRGARKHQHRLIAKAKRRGEKYQKASLYYGGGQTRSGKVTGPGLKMPANFCLDSNYAEVSAFLEKMRESLHQGMEKWIAKGRPKSNNAIITKWFDFSTIQRITPSAALVLAAEFDRLRLIGQRGLIAIDVHKWNPDVLSTLRRLGLFEIWEMDPPSYDYLENDSDNLFIIPMRSGHEVLGQAASQLNGEIANVVIEVVKSSLIGKTYSDAELDEIWDDKAGNIYIILIEAMDNVINHAYTDDKINGLRTVKRWWMTAAIDRLRSKLTVAIYDQGISIPVSLPYSENYPKIKGLIRDFLGVEHDIENPRHDGVAIRQATEASRSSTGEAHRGKGLAVMVSFIDKCRDGRLRILSRHGEFIHEKGLGGYVNAHQTSMGGTLLEWEVQL